MSEIMIPNSSVAIPGAGPLALPVPRTPISIRPGVMSDIPFMDSLQKLHTRQVGWMPTAQFEGKIRAGHVLVAEEHNDRMAAPAKLGAAGEGRVGYVIGNDQYFKRDDVGIIYQMNVVPGRQRGFVGAALLKAMFNRSAWGCKLFCCWCAQDIAANYFWEAMGFVPLAYRAGSATKGARGTPRVHIFWQKRIREGDASTPWWFPSQTGGGSIREDRIVLPIPAGTHWSEAKPIVLPGENVGCALAHQSRDRCAEAHSTSVRKKRQAEACPTNTQKTRSISMGGLRFTPPTPVKAEKAEKPPRAKRVKAKNDPRVIAAARELRDRWLEQINAGEYLPQARGKYAIERAMTPAKETPNVACPSLVLQPAA